MWGEGGSEGLLHNGVSCKAFVTKQSIILWCIPKQRTMPYIVQNTAFLMIL
jgi:hypothetical protein